MPRADDKVLQIVARIRSLEDDLQACRRHNTESISHNEECLRQISTLEHQIKRLSQEQQALQTAFTEYSSKHGLPFYEQQLSTLQQHICYLNDVLEQKAAECEGKEVVQGRMQRERSALRQQLNGMQLQQNQHTQQMNGLLDQALRMADCFEAEDYFTLALPQKTLCLNDLVRGLREREGEVRGELQRVREEHQHKMHQFKEVRIKMEYELRLIKERREDSGYYYSALEDSFRKAGEEIEGMVGKEQALQRELDQIQKNINQEEDCNYREDKEREYRYGDQIGQHRYALESIIGQRESLLDIKGKLEIGVRQSEEMYDKIRRRNNVQEKKQERGVNIGELERRNRDLSERKQQLNRQIEEIKRQLI